VWHEWATAKPADPRHPYLVAKGVQAHGLRQRGDVLLVPLHDAEGRIWNIQRIAPDGAKRFAKGGRITGVFCLVGGDPADADLLLVCEGWATAATLTEATGLPVLAAMNAGNLEPVAKAANHWSPHLPLVIAADNDHATAGNPGLTKARAAALATGATVVAPPTMPGVTDFNDLGHAETRRAFSKIAVPPVPPVPGGENPRTANNLRGGEAGTRPEPNAVPWFRAGDGGRADG
jgi:putative DNA primase/helicase